MGTTAEKLTYLNTTKQLIKESINLTDANITTQPFRQYATILKHRLPEIVGDPSIIWNNYEHVTGSGTSFSITAYNSIIDYSLKGDTTQNGTPTPDAPVPVNTVTGDQVISVNNTQYPIYLGVENLIPTSDIIGTSGTESNGVTFTRNSDGSITANGTATSAISIYINNNYTELPAGTYTFSDSVLSGESSTTFFLYADVRHINNTSWDAYNFSTISGMTQTIPEAFKFKTRIVIRNGQTLNNVVFKPQLEKGSKKNSYSEYGVPPIELCKIGTYQDYIYKDNGKWYLHKEIGKYAFTSCVNSTVNGSGETSYQSYLGDISTMLTANWGNGFSNQFTRGTVKANNIIRFGVNNKNVYIYTNDSNFADKTSADSWLASNNVIVYYVLATPTDTEITDGNLIYQLNAISLITGLNNISVSGDLPATLDLTALKYE